MKFIRALDGAMNDLVMDRNMSQRYLKEELSGRKKRRNEMLQMMMIKREFARLDEIDSRLDIHDLKIVADGVNKVREEKSLGCLVNTHYQRLLNYIEPDHVHVIMQGCIVKSGGPELAKRLEAEGYEWVKEELGIEDETVGQKA